MRHYLRYLIFIVSFFIVLAGHAQIANNCSNATTICNNQLAEKLDDGFGVQECPSGGCGCMLVGEKNTRWFRIVIQTAGNLEFTISPYNGVADYDFSVWNRGPGGSCPGASTLGSPDRCNYAAPQSPTGIKGAGNGNSNSASGNLFSNALPVAAGDVIYILVDNWDGTNVGFRLDFFGGTVGSGTGTTATFNCSGVNTCSSCSDPDCQTYRFNSPAAYSFAETAANGACHSPFAYASVKTATVCGTFTVPAPFNTVEFPLNAGYEITATNGSNTTTCLNSAVITTTIWDVCGAPIPPNPAGTGIYTGLNNATTYKVCKTVTVSGTDCWLSRVCLPFWTMIQNDEPCTAIPLTVNAAVIAGSNAGATSGFDAGCTAYQDVWYKFTAPASGRVQVNVKPDAVSDVKLSLIGPAAGLSGGVNDCNKSCSQMTNIAEGCNDYGGTGVAENLFAFVIPGQTYYVWISGTSTKPTANFTVQVSETITSAAMPKPGPQLLGGPDPIPPNDVCASATDLNPMCNLTAGTNVGATADCTDPDPVDVDALTLENDVWYKWTAPANNGNSQVTLEVTGVSCSDGAGVGTTGIQFGVFSGSCPSLTPISHGTSTITFIPVPGQTYYFVIDGNAGSQCTFNVNIKRPTITAQSCATGSYCASSGLNASFNYSFTGSNPGSKWAYCKSNTWGSACTINLDDPSTYTVYNPLNGLPSPGCTPATYTFVGYILADNGATTIAPGYPSPQPASLNCVRSTNSCTFNIYPDIKGAVTVSGTSCSQVVTANAGCASSVVISGNANQTVAAGAVGNYTPVTVTWNAPFAATAPAACNTYTIQNSYACPGPTGGNTCAAAQPLTVGGPSITTNNNVLSDPNEIMFSSDGVCANSAGFGVWFTFVAPNSGAVNINLTNVGVGDNLDAVIYLFDSRLTAIPDDAIDFTFLTDDCATCPDMNTWGKLYDQYEGCVNGNGVNGNESGVAIGLNPGETYYVMIDGFRSAIAAEKKGNFTIQVTNANPSGGVVHPANDNCLGAVDISTIGCGLFPGTNVNATSLCSSDLSIPGATTENSVWYTYTATVSGLHTIRYKNATGTHCAGVGIQPGIQFGLYTSSDNSCSGTFTNIPSATVSTGTINGSVTVSLTAGQKYYILIDGFGGNECDYDFEVYNGVACCTANLGATEGTDKVLCYGDDVTFGVTANPIDFGFNAQSNPVIGWQFSSTKPVVTNPFNPANAGKPYYVGNIDIITPGVTVTKVYRDVEGYYPRYDFDSISYYPGFNTYDGTQGQSPVTISGFPAGSTFDITKDTITLCVNIAANNFPDVDMDLIAPDGSVYRIIRDPCTNADWGQLNVCFTNKLASGSLTNISTSGACPGAGGEVAGYYLPLDAWAGLNGEGINGTWKLRVQDDDASNGYATYFYGFSLDIKKPYTTATNPVVGTDHGDFHIVNNDPFKYGPQTFWLTPVTFVNYDASTNTFTNDSCYSYGTPVKVTMLEKMTVPVFTPSCNAPGDGSNGVSLTVTSPTGGWPGVTPLAVPAQHFIVNGSGAASAISFPSPPVDVNETSTPFTVPNGQAWGVQFTDSNGCKSSISGTFDKPTVGELLMDTTVCDGDTIQYSVTIPPPLYSKYKVTIDFDNSPQDISWVMYDGAGNIVESGGGYAPGLGATTYTTSLIDPNKGPYRIEFFDGYGDGLGSGGGSTTGGGSSATNFITIEELLSTGGSNVIYNQPFAFCTPVCTIPAASVFDNFNVPLGTPNGTFSNGVTTGLYTGGICGGAPITLGVISNSNSSGSVNTNAAGVTGGNTYSVKYTFTDKYNCTTTLCQPLKVFPKVSINPTVNCVANPPVVNVNASCPGCNATYIAEYSYNSGTTWTTATSATFTDIFTLGHVRNVITGETGCEVVSTKLGDCPTILPIELVYIKAIPIDNEYIRVTWATASELNTDKFEVLRSTDAINFTKIAEIAAAGNSNNTKTYSFDDHEVSSGIIYYYQVKEIDLDRHAQLTNIVNAKLEKDKFELISIYPNPTIDNTIMTMYSKDAMDITLTVYNDIGELMKNDQKKLKEGLNEWMIDTEKWAKGVYYFIITNNYKPITKQVVKLQ